MDEVITLMTEPVTVEEDAGDRIDRMHYADGTTVLVEPFENFN